MKVLVTGVKGQLGHDILLELKKNKSIEYLGIDIEDLDITDANAVDKFIKTYKPDVVMHNAAYTAVDKAEINEEIAYKVNALGTKNIAKSCSEINSKMVYISTDYVFDGSKSGFYETNDMPAPRSAYGRTKLAGEDFVKSYLKKYFIVRISWVFGINGNNFVKTMINLSKQKKEITVVNDQIGSPTYTKDLSVFLCNLIQTDYYGTYHATNEGYCSWAEFAQTIFKIIGSSTVVIPISTEDYEKNKRNIAKRPKNSCLSKISLINKGFDRLPHWEDALRRYIKELVG